MMARAMFTTPERAAGEVERMMNMPGHALAYYVGRSDLIRLRAATTAASAAASTPAASTRSSSPAAPSHSTPSRAASPAGPPAAPRNPRSPAASPPPNARPRRGARSVGRRGGASPRGTRAYAHPRVALARPLGLARARSTLRWHPLASLRSYAPLRSARGARRDAPSETPTRSRPPSLRRDARTARGPGLCRLRLRLLPRRPALQRRLHRKLTPRGATVRPCDDSRR